MKKVSLLRSLKQIRGAIPYRSSASEFLFHLGYQGFAFPRWIRKVMAKSEYHKAWLSGFTGLGILSITELTAKPEDHITW